MSIENKKYTAEFTVTKTFGVQVVFEAPNDELAREMASDMAQDDSDFISDNCDPDTESVQSIDLDSPPDSRGEQGTKVDRAVSRWCDQWLKDRAEEEEEYESKLKEQL